jgi:hypothetical protein
VLVEEHDRAEPPVAAFRAPNACPNRHAAFRPLVLGTPSERTLKRFRAGDYPPKE